MSFKQLHGLERVFKEYGLILVFRLANKDDLMDFIDPYQSGEISGVIVSEGSLDVLVRNKAELHRIDPSCNNHQFRKDLRVLDRIAQIQGIPAEMHLRCGLYCALAMKSEKLIIRRAKNEMGSLAFHLSEFSLFMTERDDKPYAVVLDKDSGPPVPGDGLGTQLNMFQTASALYYPLDRGISRLHHQTVRYCRQIRIEP